MRKFITDILAKANLGVEQNAYVLGTVGIGTSSPVAKFDVNGTSVMRGRLTINKSTPETYGQLNVWDTTAGNGISRFADFTNGTDNNLNFYVSQVGAITKYSEIASYSSNPLVFNNASGGNVGIGTTTPGAKLDVRYDDGVTSGEHNVLASFSRNGTGPLVIGYRANGSSVSSALIRIGDGLPLTIGTTSTNQAFIILDNGNVGIGTASPTAKFEVNNNGLTGNPFYVNLGNTTGTTTLFEHTGANTPVPFRLRKSGFSGAAANYGLLYLSMNDGTAGNGSNLYFTLNDSIGNEHEYAGLGGVIRSNTNGSEQGDLVLMTSDNGTERSEKMRITSNGNVGIGTTSPSSKFEVAGKSLSRTTDNGWGQSAVANPNDAEVSFVWAAGGTGYPGVSSTYTRQWIAGLGPFGTGTDRWSLTNKTLGANTAITVLEGGNVGIGTTNPTGKVTVDYTGYGISALTAYASGAVTNWNVNSTILLKAASGSNGLAFGVSGTANDRKSWIQSGHPENIYADYLGTLAINPLGGNVGIGTTSPNGRLQINNGTDLNIAFNTTTNDSTTVSRISSLNDAATASAPLVINGNRLVFTTDVAERMRITSGGNVGIGTASPATPLHVTGGASGSGGWNRTATLAATYPGLIFNSNGTKWGGMAYDYSAAMRFWVNANNDDIFAGTLAMSILNNGNVGIGTTSPSQKLDVSGVTSTQGLYIPGLYAFGQASSGIEMQLTSTLYNAIRFYQGADSTGVIHSFGRSWVGGVSVGMINIQGYNGVSIGAWDAPTATFLSSGNVGIGTTSPSTRLDLAGGILSMGALNSGTEIRLRTGFANNSSGGVGITPIDHNGGNADGLGLYGSDGMSMWTSQTERMRIDTSGNVGIGVIPSSWSTVTPMLQIGTGGAFIGGQGSANVIRVGVNTYYDGSVWRYINSGSASWFETASGAFGWLNAAAGSAGGVASIVNLMTLSASGNLGIGTASPSEKLHVIGKGIFESNVRIYPVSESWAEGLSFIMPTAGNWGGLRWQRQRGNNDGNWYVGFTALDSTDDLVFGANNGGSQVNNIIRLTKAGNVGIGASSPTQALTIQKSGYPIIDFYDGATGRGDIGYNAGTTSFNIGAYGAIPMVFYVNSNERMRITSGGNVGIGTTSPGATLVVGTQSSGQAGTGVAQDNSIIARFGASNTAARVTGLTVANTATATISNDATLSFVVAGNYSATGLISSILQNTSTAATDMAFSVYNTSGNIERMRITAGGNVGIGTTSPGTSFSELLQVSKSDVGRISATHTNTTGSRQSDILFTEGATLQFQVGTILGNGGYDDQNWIRGVANIPLTFFTNSTERMRITSGGNVGIGTTSPLSKIQSQIESSGSALMLVNASGGGGAYVDLDFNTYTPYQSGYANPGATIRVVDNGAYSGNITFRTKGASIGATQSERMRIEASTGYVGIGTTSPSTKLTVSDTNTITNQIDLIGYSSSAKGHIGEFANNLYISTNYFYNGAQNADNSSLGQAAVVLSAGSTTTSFIDFNLSDAGANNPNVKVRIISNGNVGIGTTSPSYKLHVEGNVSGISIYASHDIAAFSDITVKKEVKRIENAIEKVKELNGYTYVRTDDETGTRRAGVIAQEVQKVLPEVVSANPDGTLNVAYSNMIALLIEGMKEQQKEIDELKKLLKK